MAAVNPSMIEALRSRLTTVTVLTPDSEGYQDSLIRWSDTGEEAGRSGIPASGHSRYSSHATLGAGNSVDIVVKGGGHSTAGTSSREGGLVIDLSRMMNVSVDASSKTVTAQGGATWKEVDEAGAAHGLSTIGGTLNHIGIGGLTLGGAQ